LFATLQAPVWSWDEEGAQKPQKKEKKRLAFGIVL
jgi:hypothetical protein